MRCYPFEDGLLQLGYILHSPLGVHVLCPGFSRHRLPPPHGRSGAQIDLEYADCSLVSTGRSKGEPSGNGASISSRLTLGDSTPQKPGEWS